MDYYRIKAGIPTVPGTEYGGPFSAYDPGGLPAESETRYGSGLGNPFAAGGAGVVAALESLFPTDEDAEISALTDPTTADFKDGLAPPKATGGGTTTPATYKPPTPTGGGVAPPPAIAAPPSSGGLSTGAMVGIAAVSVVAVGALVWAKKTGKLGGKSGKKGRLAP